jgi:hypothetical protein
VVTITDDAIVEVDVSSIVFVGKLKKAWFKWSHLTDQDVPKGARIDYKDATYSTQLSLNYYNCAERTSGSVQTAYRDDKGNVVGSFAMSPALATYTEVIPESIGESMLERVCRGPAKRSPVKPVEPAPAAQKTPGT